MSISIKENDKPKLRHCPMTCDTNLHSKLDKFEITKFLNSHSTTLMIGKPKSGKTSLLYSFLKSKELLKQVFNKIFLFQPSQSRASMKDQLFESMPDDQKYDQLNLENLLNVETNLDEGNNVIIFDDMSAFLKDNEISKLLKKLMFNRRHLHLSIIFLCQSYISVPKEIRKMFTNLFIFKVSKMEMKTIFEEVVELPSDYIIPLIKLVYDEPYNFLFVNTDSQRLFRGWDELLIE